MALGLRDFIKEEHCTARSTAYWALGKKMNKGLTPFFRDQLRLELDRDQDAVYQILIALDNVDEPAFAPERTSMSSNEHELNRRDAERYLESINESGCSPHLPPTA